eukprot:Clim_evm74s157 gene=Clim_evmTU74s157
MAAEEPEQEVQDQQKKHDSGAADLEKVTDYAEEATIGSSEQADERLKELMKEVAEEEKAAAAYEAQLLKIDVKQEDVELLAAQAEESETKAARRLREHKGDLKAALKSILA